MESESKDKWSEEEEGEFKRYSKHNEKLNKLIEDANSAQVFNLKHILKPYKDLFKSLKIYEYFSSKSTYCKHEEKTWFEHALKGFKETFKKAYLIKIVLAGLLALIRYRLKIYKNLGFLISNDTLRFALFPALFSFVYRSVLSLSKIYRNKDDGFNPILAAVLASFTIFMDNDRARRQKIALYTLIRALHTCTELSEKNNFMKKIPNSEILVFFMVSTCLPVYLYFYERDILPKGTNTVFEPMSWVKPNMVVITDIWRRQAKYKYC